MKHLVNYNKLGSKIDKKKINWNSLKTKSSTKFIMKDNNKIIEAVVKNKGEKFFSRKPIPL